MEVSIKGDNVDVGEALTSHIDDQLHTTVLKYFSKAIDASVTMTRESTYGFHAEIKVHPVRAMIIQAGASHNDAYGAFDNALERISKQLRRYKRRLKDHHKNRKNDPIIAAQYFVLQTEPQDDEVPEEGGPAIIAEMNTEIVTGSVSDAVMRMDLAHSPAQMFRNSANGRLNMVYRREDGNIGWIDPQDTDQANSV
jgi:ribosomal subunit interface protein